MIDLDALQAAAEAATPGPWTADCCSSANMVYGPSDSIGVDAVRADAVFIAAANPAVILELLTAHRDALARIARVESVRPTWPRGMYGAPQDMLSLRDLRQALTEGEPRE